MTSDFETHPIGTFDALKAKDAEIERLECSLKISQLKHRLCIARVKALEAWCEQTNQDAYEKWEALEATEQEHCDGN